MSARFITRIYFVKKILQGFENIMSNAVEN